MITVITPTIRPEGLNLVEKALKRQTYKDFEWIVISPQHVNIKGFRRIDKLLSDPPKTDDLVWTLNRAYNKAIKHSQGDLIVSWQDWTYSNPEALEKFEFHYFNNPNLIVSGVGNKYSSTNWIEIVWKDPRERDDQGSFYPCYFSDIEGNFCSVPKKAFYDVGGFDEELDKYFGMDFYGVLERMSIAGKWDFHLDQTNKSYSLSHGRPDNWEEKNALHGPYQEFKKKYLANPRLKYLV